MIEHVLNIFTVNFNKKGSFKAQKSKLVEEAYNINLFNDPIYYFNAKVEKYLPLDKMAYQKIDNGLITL
jgi:hypothetical protein